MHEDLESFIMKHKKDHVRLNTASLEVTQDMSKIVSQTLKINEFIE